MEKKKRIIESITAIESKENGLKIKVWREEENEMFDHNLNMKVMKQICAKEHKTLILLGEELLALHRVYQVEITNTLGHGCRLTKELTDNKNDYPVEP